MPEEQSELEKAEEIVRTLLPSYVAHWKVRGGLWVPLGIEAAGTVEIGEGTDVFLRFRIDNLVAWERMVWLVDYKTMAKLDPRELLKYEMDLQVTAYTYAASKVLKTRVAGMIVDALVKTKIPQFERETFVRTDEELDEFVRDFVLYAREIESAGSAVEHFPKNPKECFRYGTCPYRELCLRDTEVRRAIYDRRRPDYVDDERLLPTGEADHITRP